jgi:hypothetical protein
MTEPQFFPISPEMMALASETVSRRVSRLPFQRNGVMITGELVGVAMECLNAEFKKALPQTTPSSAAPETFRGLDRCIEERIRISGKTVVPVLTEVLCSAGIAETTEIMDRISHRPLKGIRLLTPWTWHIASPEVSVLYPGVQANGGEPVNASWTNKCPVCRTGILTRITGKQLFGIPRTDFYEECTHCGAKFIPVGTQFRLVSIAKIRDPLWKKHLDETYPPDTWAALARGSGTGSGSKPQEKVHMKNSDKLPSKSPAGGLTLTRDGSLVVPVLEKTLYFKPEKLQFSTGLRDNVFARAQKPLDEILKNPLFSHLVPAVNARYSRCLPMQSGLFLGQLKERHDPFYREFLNPYGDEKFCTFRLDEPKERDKKGVLIVVVNREIYHAVNCFSSFGEIVNETYGRILPEDCFLSGDPTRCRINALIANNRKETGIYVHTSEREEERLPITGILTRGISPDL